MQRRGKPTKNAKGGKSYKCEWLSRQDYDKGRYKNMTPTIYRRIDLVPCGKCLNCRLSYAREKAILCMLEKNTIQITNVGF